MALVNNPVMGINLRQNKNSKNAGYGKYYPEVDLQKTLTIRGIANQCLTLKHRMIMHYIRDQQIR